MNQIPVTPALSISVWIVEDDVQFRETVAYLLNHTSILQCSAEFCAFEEVQEVVDGPDPWEAQSGSGAMP